MQERDIHNMNTDLMEKKDDCVLMINYLSNRGKPIEESLLQDVARISVFVDNSLIKSEGNEDSGVEDIYSLVLKTHNKLSLLSKPANAVSIKCTEYSRGFLLKTNKTVNSIMIVTILSLLLYIICKTDIILTVKGRT